MIKFVDQSTEPVTEADIIGKFVGKEGVLNYECYGLPCLVTSVSKNRVYRDIPVISRDADGDQHILPREEWTKSDFINLASIRTICDSIEDVVALMDANRLAIRTHSRLQKAMDMELASIFEDAATASRTSDPGNAI